MMNKINLTTTAMTVVEKNEKTVIQNNEKMVKTVKTGKSENTLNDPNSLFPPQMASLPLEQVGYHESY
jgi:uncharacterized protein YbcV (DUF1398 family)